MMARNLARRSIAPLIASLIVFASIAPISARDLQPGPEPNEQELDRHGHYENRMGKTVHQPAKSLSGGVPTGATAQCRDGTYSFSQHRGGTCSSHGGATKWFR